jgi:hypothetical protein
MSDRLFSFGVFDDERTPREQRTAPVRCLEDELLPKLKPSPKCAKCHAHTLKPNDVYCVACRREVDYHERIARMRAADRLVSRALAAGFVATAKVHPQAVALCLADGRLRRANARDLRRLGLPEEMDALLPVMRRG